MISIHSLRVEGDQQILKISHLLLIFQSTPSVWRETLLLVWVWGVIVKFQSTPSVWRETYISALCSLQYIYFNPLPPCGGRPTAVRITQTSIIFQSTPSVWRETCIFLCTIMIYTNFNPLPPCGGRLRVLCAERLRHRISIHSLRVEGDECQQDA